MPVLGANLRSRKRVAEGEQYLPVLVFVAR